MIKQSENREEEKGMVVLKNGNPSVWDTYLENIL